MVMANNAPEAVLTKAAPDAEDSKRLMLDVLLKDFEVMRTEARDIVSSHWTYSVPFTLTMIAGFIGGLYRPVIMAIVPFFVLAQLAVMLNYHYGYIYLVNSYIKYIEKKINKLLKCPDLLEYENNFVPQYFTDWPKKNVWPAIADRPQPILELLMLAPSFIIFFWSVTRFSLYILEKFRVIGSMRLGAFSSALGPIAVGTFLIFCMVPLAFIGQVFYSDFSRIEGKFAAQIDRKIEKFMKDL